ncbi:MAG: signal recognition particle-docking protein FtsY [Gammaproteobacteria bacterium]|nr:signal recognition particle-docking protein FtsY [Gammaproteobacteria bacterium]
MNEETSRTNRKGILTRFSNALAKTRSQFGSGVSTLLLGGRQLDEGILEELRTQLLMSDVGVTATDRLIENLSRAVRRRKLRDGESALDALRVDIEQAVMPLQKSFELSESRPFVILVVGVNGVGKTTTIGKLSHYLQRQGHSVLLAAGDTYRAAAIEQLQAWGRRTDVGVIAQRPGADSASVIYDAVESAAARGTEVVIADTAGRLQNKTNLMAELAKIRRVIQRYDDSAPHETLLILDANIGQNAISQVQEFTEAAAITGMIVTKLDGSAKAGVILGIASENPLPLYFVGLGETQDDLQPFDARAYVNGLFVS